MSSERRLNPYWYGPKQIKEGWAKTYTLFETEARCMYLANPCKETFDFWTARMLEWNQWATENGESAG